jgi:quinol monooxygenase YgiN
MPRILVAATLDYPTQARRDEIIALVASVQMKTRTEETGCIAYYFAPDAGLPTRIVVFEEWTDAGALLQHFQHPNYFLMKKLLALDEVTGAWNQMYKVASQEAVYDASGSVIEEFLKNT